MAASYIANLCGHLEVAADCADHASIALRLTEIETEFRLVEQALMVEAQG
jgi:hypothetical protein